MLGAALVLASTGLFTGNRSWLLLAPGTLGLLGSAVPTWFVVRERAAREVCLARPTAPSAAAAPGCRLR